MCLRLAVLVVVAAALLLMCGPDPGKVARGIVVLPLRCGRECGIVVAGMLSLREFARGDGSEDGIGWSETRLSCFSRDSCRNAPATQRWRELRVAERYTLGKTYSPSPILSIFPESTNTWETVMLSGLLDRPIPLGRCKTVVESRLGSELVSIL